jgi:hypothetical protein
MKLSNHTWSVCRLWKNETVFILGGGPSLQQSDVNRLKDRRVIAVNDSFRLGDWIDIVWFTDCRWYNDTKEALSHFPGLIIGAPPCKCEHPGVLRVARKNQPGISINPNFVYWNKNSGSSAINLAYLLGATKIVLLGFDMKVTDNKHNWHSYHSFTPRNDIYADLFLPCYEKIAEDAKKLNLTILNATTNSAITVFPIIHLSEVL